uniref:Uncharacterized protein n=1 Tax=Oryza glumipatula TaxID=40148 RepID=A0A0E0B7X8_9ORYZ
MARRARFRWGGSVTPTTVGGGGAARITQSSRANCVVCCGGRGNSEAPTTVRFEAWGIGSSTSTLGLGFAELYNQRFDVGDSKPRTFPWKAEPREERGEGERGAGLPVAKVWKRQWHIVFPVDAHSGRPAVGREEERDGRNSSGKSLAPAGLGGGGGGLTQGGREGGKG